MPASASATHSANCVSPTAPMPSTFPIMSWNGRARRRHDLDDPVRLLLDHAAHHHRAVDEHGDVDDEAHRVAEPGVEPARVRRVALVGDRHHPHADALLDGVEHELGRTGRLQPRPPHHVADGVFEPELRREAAASLGVVRRLALALEQPGGQDEVAVEFAALDAGAQAVLRHVRHGHGIAVREPLAERRAEPLRPVEDRDRLRPVVLRQHADGDGDGDEQQQHHRREHRGDDEALRPDPAEVLAPGDDGDFVHGRARGSGADSAMAVGAPAR